MVGDSTLGRYWMQSFPQELFFLRTNYCHARFLCIFFKVSGARMSFSDGKCLIC